jgi:two-component system response regulator GlrR
MTEKVEHRDVAHLEPVVAAERPIGRRRGDRIVGADPATQEGVEQVRVAARNEQPVWISGPPGAGKSHFARALHAWSARSGGPFVEVNCTAVPEALLAREIFGCSAGTYPDLPEEHTGALARAAGGTLLLREVERLPEAVHRTLAAAITDGRFSREGDGTSSPLRARLVFTSTARRGASPLGDGLVHELDLLPLSQRREDVLPLAAHFLRIAADEEGVRAVGFTSDARNALLAEPWPGNVRELFERVRQAVRLAGDGAISAEALLLAADGENIPSFKEAKRAFETRYVVGLLRRCGGNISRAARLAKKDRKDFYDVIRRTGVNPSDFR